MLKELHDTFVIIHDQNLIHRPPSSHKYLGIIPNSRGKKAPAGRSTAEPTEEFGGIGLRFYFGRVNKLSACHDQHLLLQLSDFKWLYQILFGSRRQTLLNRSGISNG